jgi:predicted dinucleotide-binding enzyme
MDLSSGLQDWHEIENEDRIAWRRKCGGALGVAWSQRGHKMFFGVRDPEAADIKQTLAACRAGARAGTLADAVAFGEVIVLALPWSAVESALAVLNLDGRVLIDCTNPPAGVVGAEAIARKFPCRQGGQVLQHHWR